MSGEGTETLHLIYLERESGGIYACAAANSEGETRSSTLTLKVQCKFSHTFSLIIPFNIDCIVRRSVIN